MRRLPRSIAPPVYPPFREGIAGQTILALKVARWGDIALRRKGLRLLLHRAYETRFARAVVWGQEHFKTKGADVLIQVIRGLMGTPEWGRVA